MVKKILKEDLANARKISKNAVDIKIAVVDLNADGSPEIMSYINQWPYFCGVDGCWMNVYQKANGTWKRIMNVIIKEDVEVSDARTNGYKDTFLEEKTTWKWNGRDYAVDSSS